MCSFIVLAMILVWKYKRKTARTRQKMQDRETGKTAAHAKKIVSGKGKSFPMSVIVNGLQTMTIFIGFDLGWPKWVKTVSGFAGGVVFMNPIELFSPECEMNVGYSTKVVMYILTPWMMLGLFALARNRVIATARAVYVDAHFSELSQGAVSKLSVKQVQGITSEKNAKFNHDLLKTQQQIKALKLSSIHQENDNKNSVDDNIRGGMHVDDDADDADDAVDYVDYDDMEDGFIFPDDDAQAKKTEEDSAPDKDMVIIALSALSLQNIGMSLLMNLYTLMVVVTTEPYSCIADNLGIQYLAADPSIRCWRVD